MEKRASIDWVYDHLICEFSHWDICLSGLVEKNGEKLFCRLEKDDYQHKRPMYSLRKIKWSDECEEYLRDYRETYIHWFHDIKPRVPYDGRPIKPFRDKWNGRNPVEEATVMTEVNYE